MLCYMNNIQNQNDIYNQNKIISYTFPSIEQVRKYKIILNHTISIHLEQNIRYKTILRKLGLNFNLVKIVHFYIIAIKTDVAIN